MTTWLAAQLVFPTLAALSGIAGGYQFPFAVGLYLDECKNQPGLGTLYAIDLMGGCAGALLLSTYFIPIFGFWKTAWLSATMNLVLALLAAGCFDFARGGHERSRLGVTEDHCGE